MRTRQFLMLALILTAIIGLGSRAAYAASLCVHPAGAARCFTSIQAAVNAAQDGDIIVIRAGKYVEQVSISGKDLTLVGRPGATIQAPAEMQDLLSPLFGFPGRPVLLVTDAQVTVRDLTVDGRNSAEANPFLQGIVFLNADGIIRDNLVKNIGFGEPRLPLDEHGQPVYQGDAIVVISFQATPRAVTIAENRVINFNNNGILVDAEADPGDPAVANLAVEVLDNTVVGSGPTDVIDQWGIFIGGFGFADPQFSLTGVVKGNRVRDLVTVGAYPLPGIGMVIFNSYNLEVAKNTVENVRLGLAANQVVGAQISHNEIEGSGPDVSGTLGLLLSGMDSTVFKNRFRKLDNGILLFVEDPQLGSAFNTVIDDNKFDNVALDVMTGTSPQPMATGSTRVAPMWRKLPDH